MMNFRKVYEILEREPHVFMATACNSVKNTKVIKTIIFLTDFQMHYYTKEVFLT